MEERRRPPRRSKSSSVPGQKISEAVTQLDRIDDIKKAAGSIHKNADKIETGCTAVTAGIHRLLSEALAAIADVQTDNDIPDAADGAVA